MPSVDGQFKKGNKAASKRVFRDALNRAIKQRQGDALRDVAEALLDQALNGEGWAIKELADRIEGKAVQAQEITGADGESLFKGIEVRLVSASRDD